MLASGLALLHFVQPTWLPTWWARQVCLRDVPWPRDTALFAPAFREGVLKVARGSDVVLLVEADTAKRVPDRVRLSYRTAQGARGRASMVRDGEADPARDPRQRFTHTFSALLSSLTVDVAGGDDRLRGLRIEVVDSPTLVATTLDVAYPAYLEREAESLAVRGSIDLPVGSTLRLTARANKPLDEAQVRLAAGGEPQRLAPRGDDPAELELTLPTLSQDQSLEFTLLDRDGIQNLQPIRLALRAIPDTAPRITIRPQGVGASLTARSRIPWQGRAEDDHGLGRLWQMLRAEDATGPLLEQDLALPAAAELQASEKNGEQADEQGEVRGEVDLRPLELAVGRKLSLSVHAVDRSTLAAEPQAGASETFRFEVVTPQALLAILENRELNLRRRFESTIEEVEQLADALATAADDGFDAKDAGEPAEGGPTARELTGVRWRQGARKNAEETLGVGKAFQSLLEEYALNDLANPERTSRLVAGIIQPLLHTGDVSFAELTARLETWKNAAPADAAPVLAAAREHSQVVLAEMRAVLKNMLELETFNEAIDQLRSIIAAQERVNRQTEARKKQKTRELLED